MNISFSGIIFILCCILVAFTIIGIILLRLSSGSSKSNGNVDEEEEAMEYENKKRLVAQKAERAHQLLQRDKGEFEIAYGHDLPTSFYKKEELYNMRRGNIRNGKQKVTA